MFTRSSVHCADRIVAVSSSYALRWSSDVFASGYSACRRRMISAARSRFAALLSRPRGRAGRPFGACGRFAARVSVRFATTLLSALREVRLDVLQRPRVDDLSGRQPRLARDADAVTYDLHALHRMCVRIDCRADTELPRGRPVLPRHVQTV